MTDEEATRVMDAVLSEYGEDYQSTAAFLRVLRRAGNDTDWIGVLRQRASGYAPFAESGLSVEWWVDTVDQMSKVA